MKVSIIVPNYNGREYLKACLDSLSRQSFTGFETIVVDNGSTDGSYELIQKEFPEVNCIVLDRNYGFSKAVNVGIKAAIGEYVVLLNNDTEVEQDWLENLTSCMEGDLSIFSCCSKMLQYYNREKIDDAGDEYTALGWAYKRGDGQSHQMYKEIEEVFSSCAGAAIYRKNIFDEIGYFDEHFFAYMEDVDISYRAKIHGYKNIYCAHAIVYHIASATSGSKYNPFKVRLAARNNIYVAYKNMPLPQLIINLPFLFLGFFVKYFFFFKQGFGKVYFEGLKEGITNLNKIEKVKYKNKNLLNYAKIELALIKNTFKYFFLKIKKIQLKIN